jgi:glycosyltransferase involved in cell wall biosynthesis
MKIDLHVHSAFSRRPSQWILQKISCPESFTDPLQVYRTAKDKGMSMVTLCDHNTIDGALEIAHFQDTFISEEITSYFPEDGCKVHVLALNITESQHREIQKLRQNIFDLVTYLNQEKIVHVQAHPLYGVNDRLTLDHFEQMILLFKNFELNGARNNRQNQILSDVLGALTPADIETLQNKHGIDPLFFEPWKKNLTGGSDDHSGLNIARTYTTVHRAPGVGAFLAGLEQGRARVVTRPSTPQTMAHNLYGIAYQFYRNRLNLGRHAGKDRLLTFLDQSLMPESREENSLMSRLYAYLSRRKAWRGKGMPDTMMKLIRQETERMFQDNPEFISLARSDAGDSGNREKIWFDFVNQLSSKVLSHTGNHLLGQASGANLFNIFQTLGSVGGLYSLLAPYFVSFAHFAKDNEMNAMVLDRFGKKVAPASQHQVNLGHFTDTFYDVNGVAQTLQQQVKTALKHNKHLTIITCEDNPKTPGEGVKNFAPIGVYNIPEYTEQQLYYPPFLEMLDFCYKQGFTHIHSATPGPVGLAALAIARILKLPLTATYHTQFPQYAQALTGDDFIEDMTWRFMIWYYDQMDQIYVSSQNSRDELTQRGISKDKIRLIPRGIDTEHFHPDNRCNILTRDYGVDPGVTNFLYVGRVSKEKNLPLLVQAFINLYRENKNVHLTVVGDGPWAAEMKQLLRDVPAAFTGYLSGTPLHQVYASADAFVFPSTTDTFGNVVLEAQASGIPVIVSDIGGPCENMLPDHTGLKVKSKDLNQLISAMKTLADDRDLRHNMGLAARAYMEDRSFDTAFIRFWEFYKKIDIPADTPRFSKAG